MSYARINYNGIHSVTYYKIQAINNKLCNHGLRTKCHFNNFYKHNSVLLNHTYSSKQRSRVIFRIQNATDEDISIQIEELKIDAEDRMEKSLQSITQKLNTIRTGRANPRLLDNIEVSYYGALTPLKSLATISAPDASTLLVNPFDKGSIEEVEKAIRESDLGFNPGNDGERIRISIPQLTEERRKDMVKMASKFGEEGKVAVRNIRRDILKSADKLVIGEDSQEDFKQEIQKMTDEFIKKIEKIINDKSNELSKI